MSERYTGPRNRTAAARGQRRRTEIRRVWLELIRLRPFEPVTARTLAPLLTFKIERTTLCWHMRAIRTEALIADVPCADTLPPREFIT
jgi:hypothetical protein